MPYLAALGLTSEKVVLDRFGKVSEAYGAVLDGGNKVSLPRTVVLDASARVRAIFWTEGADYIDRIVSALGSK